MFGIGSGEVILIIIVAIIVLGPKKLPEFARNAGKLIANLKSATSELKRNLEQEIGVDELSKLNPRKIAEDIIAGEDISDIHPGKYIKKTVEKEIEDMYPDTSSKKKADQDKKPSDTAKTLKKAKPADALTTPASAVKRDGKKPGEKNIKPSATKETKKTSKAKKGTDEREKTR